MTRPNGLRADDAEHHLAGIAVISAHGAHLALSRLDQSDFYDPLAWRVVEAAAALPLVMHGPDPIDARAEAVSAAVGMYPAKLAEWIAATPCMWDKSGHLARRVREAARRRRLADMHLAALEALGLEVQWSRVA